ncbi:nitroreductase family protein [Butyrivibrio sp. AE3004]|uniref:nitroreductase family protein n=1 Tax=Butyrivibrio sp. AE3004 TaxID=1506994 RepID=UPI0004947858|nr:nitroreductase family protein [Butyrivibrio sp. AE3004]
MNYIEAIKERHSVRNYTPEHIQAEKIVKLNEKIRELNEAGNLHLQLMEDAGNTYNRLLNRAMGLGSAPSVIACVGPDDDTLEQRIGYYGEKLVLFAQTLGLNTCWAGTFNKKNIGAEIRNGEKLVISIAIGYGKDKGKPRKSKTMDQVVDAKGERPFWFNNGVEMALLAPTAINQQKFVIKLNEDQSVEFIDKGGIFSQVDLGIVKCHFEIGSERAIGKFF